MAKATSFARLLNGYYSQPEFFTADVATGTTRTPAGTRICTLTDDFLRGFRSAVQFECGKATDRIYKSCGRRWGTTFAMRFDRELGQHFGTPLGELSAGVVQRSLDEAFRYHGWGRLAVDLSAYDQGIVQLAVSDPVMPAVMGPIERPSDVLMAGFLAGVFSHFAATELDCQQTDCPSRGADRSRFVLGDPTRLAAVVGWVKDRLSHSAIVQRLIAQIDVGSTVSGGAGS